MSYSANFLARIAVRQILATTFFENIKAIVCVIALVLLSTTAQAQRVSPMVFELEPTGSQSATSLRVENNKEEAMTVEFIATKINLDEYGNETRTPADEDFLIYPPQALIQSGKAQVVKVKYVGDPVITESTAYRVSVIQLAVQSDDPSFQGIGVLVNFNTLVNVSPLDSKPELAVSQIKAVTDDKWELLIENTGNRFCRFSKTTWEIKSTVDPNNVHSLGQLEVGQLLDKNLIVPNSKLRVTIPAIEGFDPTQTSISISSDT